MWVQIWATVSPQLSPRGFICTNELMGGGLFKGRAYLRGPISKFGTF